MGSAAGRMRRRVQGKRADQQMTPVGRWESSVEQRDSGVQQLFVRNLAGRSVGVNTDLDQDVSFLASAFAARESLNRTSQLAMRFTFSGRQLEPGVPLWKYGIAKGSNVHALACPCPRSQSSGSRPRGRTAWTGPQDDHKDDGGGRPSALAAPKVEIEADSVVQLAKTRWVELPVTITTPFAEVEGMLAFPEQSWSSCRLSPGVLRKMICVTDVLGVYAPRSETLMGGWQLRMLEMQPFPCVQPPAYADVWERLGATTARVEIWAPQEALLRDARALVNEDDELHLGLVDVTLAGEMHVSVSLLRDAELAVDDVTVRFREQRGVTGAKDEVCSVCLEPMLPGEMCRRLACLHCLHAGCAMTLLPEVPCCPVCRSSIVPLPQMPESLGAASSERRTSSSSDGSGALLLGVFDAAGPQDIGGT